MIPTPKQVKLLFDKYNLPSLKRIHVEEVAKLAKYLANKFKIQNSKIKINEELIEAAALLHDIDKNAPKITGERHPDAAVRILNELGFAEVAEVVKKHSLHCILDPQLEPKTWEEKIVYLADKMVKYEVIGVDHRFKLWYKENLPEAAVSVLNASYPKVKILEQEIFSLAGLIFTQIQKDFQKYLNI